MSASAPWLYIVASAAPPVLHVSEFVTQLQAEGWQCCLIATPNAASWIDLDEVSTITGCLTRVHPGSPHRPDSLPRAEAVVAAPMTFNSINKWAAGISDTLALGVLNEMLGVEVPIVVAPCVKASLRSHPAYQESIARLTKAGVSMIDPDAVTGRDADGLAVFDWPQIVDVLKAHR